MIANMGETPMPPSHRLEFLDDSLGFDFFWVLHTGDGSVGFPQGFAGGIGQVGQGNKNSLGPFGGRQMVRDDADAFDGRRVEREVRKFLGESEDRAQQFRRPGGLGKMD